MLSLDWVVPQLEAIMFELEDYISSDEEAREMYLLLQQCISLADSYAEKIASEPYKARRRRRSKHYGGREY